MNKLPKILAIIPARGGSKSIPRKNLRLLGEKPLLSYAIETALSTKIINKVLVSTEDEEIAEFAKIYGIEIVHRPKFLAKDDTPLDPVVFHALNYIEKKESTRYELVLTIQPTSPFLKKETIEKAIRILLHKNFDTLITVVKKTRLYWTKKNGHFVPLYNERKNRQYLNPIYMESGSLLISKREVINKKSRIGKNIYLYELNEEEGIDIDTYIDWRIAEYLVNRLKILFRVDGDFNIGLGHIYRALTIANRILGHEIIFLTEKTKLLGIKKIKEYRYPIQTFKSENELFDKIKKFNPDIVINDILDTDKNYIQKLKNEGYFVINFEDLGEGGAFADMVFNSLYEYSDPPKNHYYGYKYFCLRDEFYMYKPKEVKRDVENILVTFGGIDQNNLTLRTLKSIEMLKNKNIKITIILGLGFKFHKELINYMTFLKKEGFNIELKKNVKNMGKYISNADIVITSNGRTIYEIASLGIPCISISQNEREAMHLFSRICKGVLNLGIAYEVSEKDIMLALKNLIEHYGLRKKMNRNLLKFNLRKGVKRVVRLILDSYWEWREQCVKKLK